MNDFPLTPDRVAGLLDRLGARTLRTARHFGKDELPDYYDVNAARWVVNGGWTEGFWPGLLWELHAHTGDAGLAAEARRTTRLVARLKADTDDHDLGFLFEPSCVAEIVVTGNEAMVPAARAAAKRLLARFLPEARYIPAHGPIGGPQAGFAIIDTVMNLPLLCWAAALTQRADFTHAAVEAARTIAREHVRADGSSCQVLWLDPATGRTVRREAVMAAGVDTCWARGQAWGIHGFARLHRLTDLPEFRLVAERMAGYFLSRVPPDGVVWHDFDDPSVPSVPKDASAQAIAAGGLVWLAEAATGGERQRWLASAEGLLRPLLERCLVAEPPSADVPRGLLGQACKSLRKGQGIVSEIVFGDYYLVDALRRWLRVAGA